MDLGPAADEGATSATLLGLIQRGHSFSGREPHCLYLNTGGTRFANVSAASHFDFPDDGRALGLVDWDHDGDMDLWISNRNGPQIRFLRNDIPQANHFLKLRLKSATGNRDAIGARVEVVPKRATAKRLVKTLRAGDGYLSQSSKWLSFGLGADVDVDHVLVYWPGGDEERVDGMAADKSYVITQGDSAARQWNPQQRTVALQPSDLQPANANSPIAISSLSRTPLLPLEYPTLHGQTVPLYQTSEDGKDSPTLIVLWSATCLPCLNELREFRQHQDRIRASGLEIVALNVDDLAGNNSVKRDEARQLLDHVGFPFATGMATTRIVDFLQLINDHIFDLNLPLPVPSSFLVDASGQLNGVYKGPVDIERVLDDVTDTKRSISRRRDRAVPFSGRWAEKPIALSFRPLITEMISRDMLPIADQYVRQPLPVEPRELFQLIHRVAMTLVDKGQYQQADEHFAALRLINPTNVDVELAIGARREREGQHGEALRLYREAVRRSPNNVGALNNLAWLLATTADSKLRSAADAIEFARKAVALTQESEPAILDTLAAAYAANKNFDRAIFTVDSALALATEREDDARLIEGLQKRRELYGRQIAFTQ